MTPFEQYAIMSPKAGIKTDAPKVLLADEFAANNENVWVHNERIDRARLRLREFSAVLPDAVNGIDYFVKKNLDAILLVMTKRDICYRDDANDRFVYITKQYIVGTASFVNGDATVEFAGGADTVNMKIGDFIKTGAGVATTNDTWYEILSITDGDTIELTEDYAEANTGAVAYILRDTFDGVVTDLWEFDTCSEDKWLATNLGINYPVCWSGTGDTTVTDITTLFKAKHLKCFEGYTVWGHLVGFPQRERWSGLDDFDEYTPGTLGSGAADVYGQEEITGFGKWQDFLVIFKETSITVQWTVVTDDIFQKTRRVDGIGCKAAKSIINRDKVYFWSNDNKFRAFNGLHANEDISFDIDNLVTLIAPNYEKEICGTFWEELKQLAWAVPKEVGSTANDRILLYDLDTKSWSKLDVPAVCFGAYVTEMNLTWDTLPYSTWDEWGGRWDGREFLSNAPIDLVGCSDGYVYRIHGAELDNDVAYTGYFELNQNGFGMLNTRKRLLRMRLYLHREAGGTVNVAMRVDDKLDLETAVSKNLDDQGDRDLQEIMVPCDYGGKAFGLYVSGTNPFRFVGVLYEFIPIGDR